MFSLRQKLLFSFGGLLAILLIVGALGIILLTRYSETIERIYRENYDSVIYGQNMKDAIERMDDRIQAALWGELGALEGKVEEIISRFEENLARESGNITLPGEKEIVDELVGLWREYHAPYSSVFASTQGGDARRAAYREKLLPLSQQIKATAQRVIDINLQNIVSVDGQVRLSAVNAKRAMYGLIAIGTLLAILLVGFFSRSILRPLGALTRSAREIERGNLDLVVSVPSRDEIGQLAEAFNSMASRLREFRRTDRTKLLRTQRTTQLAINSLPDAVAVFGPDDNVELANNAAQELFQLHPGANVATFPHKGVVELYRKASREVRALEPEGYDSAIQVLNGTERFFLPQLVPIIDEERQLAGMTLVLVDVTNLRRLDEMKSGLLSVVSHELKTPLTSMRMAVHLLLDEKLGPLTEKQAELLLAAREDSDRLSKILDNLLDMTRIASGRGLMELKPTGSEHLVLQAAESFRASYRDKGVRLDCRVPDDTPDVLADPTRIGHVFANLLSNALKYTPSGGEVSVRAQAEGKFVCFTVRDTGTGILREHVDRVFERFFRVPGQGAESGAGLGLAIAREIVEAHGGRIWVESQEGAGSTFSFTLPQVATNPQETKS
jgi:NtrC-family two-component system sensor histidine kinase KinB